MQMLRLHVNWLGLVEKVKLSSIVRVYTRTMGHYTVYCQCHFHSAVAMISVSVLLQCVLVVSHVFVTVYAKELLFSINEIPLASACVTTIC